MGVQADSHANPCTLECRKVRNVKSVVPRNLKQLLLALRDMGHSGTLAKAFESSRRQRSTGAAVSGEAGEGGIKAQQRVRTALQAALNRAIYILTPTSKTHYNFEVSEVKTSFERVNIEGLRRNWCQQASNTTLVTPGVTAKHQLPYRGVTKVVFETAPKQPASSITTMHMDATVTVTEKTVSVILHSLGIYSEPLHMEEERHAGPCPTMVDAKIKATSGTTGHPRSSWWSASGRIKGTYKGTDDITWARDQDDVSASYSGIVNNWKTPVALKKHPTVPDSTLRLRKWRELPYSDDLATGFVDPDAGHVVTWWLKGNGEKISFELTLFGRVGILMYDPKLWGGKYLYMSKSFSTKPELWIPSESNTI